MEREQVRPVIRACTTEDLRVLLMGVLQDQCSSDKQWIQEATFELLERGHDELNKPLVEGPAGTVARPKL